MTEPVDRRIRPRHEISLGEADQTAFIDAIPLRARAIVEAPDFLPKTRKHIEKFRRVLESSKVYNEQDKSLITKALDLAIVAYQDNENEALRTRRQTVRYKGKDVPTPYIEHPLSVAMAMMGQLRKVKLKTDKADGSMDTLNVKQHAYKAEVIASALLHDVIEDSKLAIPNKNESIEGRDEWNSFIRKYFAGNSHDSVNSIITVVNAVTKYDVVPDYVRRAIENSDLFDTVVNQLHNQGLDSNRESTKAQVVRSLSDLHKMMETCFGREGEDMPFDAKSFLNFYSALAVKCHDIENNLEDGGVKNDKLVRAHIYATLARIFGLPVASRIVVHLATATNYDMYWGTGNAEELKKQSKRSVRIYTDRENSRKKPIFRILGKKLRADAIQMPILSEAEIVATHNFRPVLQYKMIIRNNPKYLAKIDRFFHETEYNLLKVQMEEKVEEVVEGKVISRVELRDYVGAPLLQENQNSILESGRLCYYFNIYRATKDGQIDPNNPGLIGIYRIQDDQPSAHEVLKAGESPDPTTIPEGKIISKKFKGSPRSTMKVSAVVGSVVEEA